MNRLFRIISVILPLIGIGFMIYYFIEVGNAPDKISVLSEPSYIFIRQNNMTAFFSGVGVVFSGMLACFFAWLRKMDSRSRVLPNAVSADREEIATWVSGSSLDISDEKSRVLQVPDTGDTELIQDNDDRTEVLDESGKRDA